MERDKVEIEKLMTWGKRYSLYSDCMKVMDENEKEQFNVVKWKSDAEMNEFYDSICNKYGIDRRNH